MGIMDANGRVRPGVFEKIYDEETDTTFTPSHGTGRRMVLKADGPKVQGDGIVEIGGRRGLTMSEKLRFHAEQQGVLPMPAIDLGMVVMGRKKK